MQNKGLKTHEIVTVWLGSSELMTPHCEIAFILLHLQSYWGKMDWKMAQWPELYLREDRIVKVLKYIFPGIEKCHAYQKKKVSFHYWLSIYAYFPLTK